MDTCKARLLALFLLVSFTYCAMAKRGFKKHTLDFKDETKNNESSKEKEKLLELITNEGKLGWSKNAAKMAKEKGKKMKATGEMQPEKSRDLGNSSILLADSGPPKQLISSISSKLTGFTSPLATRVKSTVSGLNDKWNKLSDDEREGIAGTLGVIGESLEKFGNAGKDPLGAIRAGIDIIGSIASNFGPQGQLLSMGLGFVSSLLGLFGKGPKPKPMSQVVREQIDEALAKYRDEDLTAKAKGLITAFKESKAYLDGAANSGNPFTEQEMQLASTRVPMTQGAEFMGELASVILKMFKDNKVSDAKKCIKYCELYATLTSIRDMILTQFISMSSNAKNMQNDVNGLIGYRQNFRDGTKALFEKLYTVDYFSNIMPYFDPDDSTVTDTYSTVMLNLGKYDRSLSGQYCLQYLGKHDLDWQREEGQFELDDRPYTSLLPPSSNNLNCYWKLVPHGQSTYSIVNKYKCDEKYDYCGAMLSWDSDDDKAYVGLDNEDPVLWEISGYDWRYIRNKWHCPSEKFCDRDLRVLARKESKFWQGSKTLLVGQLALPDGKYYWKLKKRT